MRTLPNFLYLCSVLPNTKDVFTWGKAPKN